MNWTCEQIEERLSDYVDRLLAADERGGFEAHLSGCARCAPLVERVAGLVTEMHRLEPLAVPPRLYDAILNQTLGARSEKRGWRAWLGWLRPVWQPRFTYGAVSVLVTFAVLTQALDVQWRRPTLADLNPVNVYRAANRRGHLIYARGAKFFSDLRVVYEIQSRLRPEGEAQAEPEPAPGPVEKPGQTNRLQPTKPRELNRANEKDRMAPVLACSLNALSTGSLR